MPVPAEFTNTVSVLYWEIDSFFSRPDPLNRARVDVAPQISHGTEQLGCNLNGAALKTGVLCSCRCTSEFSGRSTSPPHFREVTDDTMLDGQGLLKPENCV
ncbi:hypothetical protein EDB80DRAFT_815436 [Ilyonectria destructans]|nr:hypothetical protein EDB80DRAFT_815436 [Ilyonectria destructans]